MRSTKTIAIPNDEGDTIVCSRKASSPVQESYHHKCLFIWEAENEFSIRQLSDRVQSWILPIGEAYCIMNTKTVDVNIEIRDTKYFNMQRAKCDECSSNSFESKWIWLWSHACSNQKSFLPNPTRDTWSISNTFPWIKVRMMKCYLQIMLVDCQRTEEILVDEPRLL